MSKVITAEQAAMFVKDSMTVGVSGFTTYGSPEDLNTALQERYLSTQSPKDLTLFHIAATGDSAEGGANHFGEAGLVKRLICGHIGMEPRLNKLTVANQVETFLIPQGVCSHLTRAIAGHKPGVLTHIGLKTFCDPRIEGCKSNQAAVDGGHEVVELVQLGGKEYLLYKSFPIDICFIKGTYADESGNITLKGEANITEQLELAAAAHNSGGIVVCEVDKLVKDGSISVRDVDIHGFMIDYVVVGSKVNQSIAYEGHKPEMCGELEIPLSSIEPPALDVRKVCARRCALEVRKGILLNLGYGVPDLVGKIIAEEGGLGTFTLSIESGVIGGVSQGGILLGGSINAEAFYKQPDIFDIYDGGGIDMSCLGVAEIDAKGNVNVSKFGGRVVGPGGFINISQNAKKLCFAGTFTSGKMEIAVEDGKLKIVKDGGGVKFKKQVEQITFSGEYASSIRQEVLYITERAVFRLVEGGIMLTEIAPGVDLEKDILSKMEFKPIISEDLKQMDARIFREEKMGLTF